MHLKLLLPYRVFADKGDVLRIVADTTQGSVGILPNRLDCSAALVPGIFCYETRADGTVYVAVDEGVLVKAGADVLVSVRRAVAGKDLGQLQEAVKRDFLTMDEKEHDVRAALERMEGGFIRRFSEFQDER